MGTLTMNNNYISHNNNESSSNKRVVNISQLLEEDETEFIINYVGTEASLLSAGVCELLTEANGKWVNPQRGIACLIKDSSTKTYSISLLRPASSSKVVWFRKLNRSFQTIKNHDNLITFELKDTDDEEVVYGLNFVSTREAQLFHTAVLDQYESYMLRKEKPTKRRAPDPPSNSAEMMQASETSKVTEMGVIIPQTVEKKKEKKGLLAIFGKKKKKDKKKLTSVDISCPTDFKHVYHEQSTENSTGTKEAFIEKPSINIEDELPNRTVVETQEEKIEHIKLDHTLNEHFIRQTVGLGETRSSIMIPKTGKGNTPREVKRISSNKKTEIIHVDRTPTPAPSQLGMKEFDPINPNWDEGPSIAKVVPPSHSVRPERPALPSSQSVSRQPVPEETPPELPTRTISRRPFTRQNTPPHPDIIRKPRTPPPRLPSDNTYTYNSSTSTKITYECMSISNTPRRPPLPSSTVSPPEMIIKNTTSSIPQAPPPPPPNLLSTPSFMKSPPASSHEHAETSTLTSPVPPVSPDRRSFLNEIENVDKRTLLKSVSDSRKDSRKVSGEEKGDIMSSLQKMFDTMRPQIEDSDSDSEEDSSSDSDWSE